jgi:hypothetical protein
MEYIVASEKAYTFIKENEGELAVIIDDALEILEMDQDESEDAISKAEDYLVDDLLDLVRRNGVK